MFMKKLFKFAFCFAFSALALCGCDIIPYGGWIVDWAPVEIYITATDDDGNSIISPEMQGMSLTFKGVTYNVQDSNVPGHDENLSCNVPDTDEVAKVSYREEPETKAYLAILYGLKVEPYAEKEGVTEYRLKFGEIDGAADMDEDIVLRWPDGSSDTIHYHCSNHREGPNPKCNRSWKLNGRKHDGNVFAFSGKNL